MANQLPPWSAFPNPSRERGPLQPGSRRRASEPKSGGGETPKPVLMASLLLAVGGVLISAVVLLQGIAAHIHLTNTSASLFRQNAAGPLVGFGLGGLLVSAAAGVGVLTYGRRQSAMAVATGAVALLLAGGAALAGHVLHGHNLQPGPTYQQEIASFPSDPSLTLIKTFDAAATAVRPPASFRTWTSEGSIAVVCTALENSFKQWVDPGTAQVTPGDTVRARGIACEISGMKNGYEADLEVGQTLDLVHQDLAGPAGGQIPTGSEGPAVVLEVTGIT